MLQASDTNYEVTFRKETMDLSMLLAKTIIAFYSLKVTNTLSLQMSLQRNIDQVKENKNWVN